MNLSKNTILVKFELRKLLHIVSIVAITLLFFLVLKSAQKPYLSRSFYFVNAKGKPDSYPGGLKDSIARETKVQDTYRGPITVERLKDALAAYKELSENFGIDGERTWGDEYRFAADVMKQAFSKPGQRNIYIMNMIDAADLEHTYTGRIQQLMDSMQFAKNRIHNSPKVAELARRVTVPFYYGGFDMVWDILRRTLPVNYYVLIVCIFERNRIIFVHSAVVSGGTGQEKPCFGKNSSPLYFYHHSVFFERRYVLRDLIFPLRCRGRKQCHPNILVLFIVYRDSNAKYTFVFHHILFCGSLCFAADILYFIVCKEYHYNRYRNFVSVLQRKCHTGRFVLGAGSIFVSRVRA